MGFLQEVFPIFGSSGIALDETLFKGRDCLIYICRFGTPHSIQNSAGMLIVCWVNRLEYSRSNYLKMQIFPNFSYMDCLFNYKFIYCTCVYVYVLEYIH